MLWGNPLALIGLAAVAVPLLIHLLVAARARRIAFPTLRFLPEAVPVALRARRIADRWLLLVRCLIVALGAVALAQPWLVRGGDRGDGTAAVPLAVVVDASDSMTRSTPEGGTALEVARRRAAEIAAARPQGTIIESDDLAAGINAATGWLATASGDGAGEVVVVSDFQRHSLTAGNVDNLPDVVGLRLVRVPASGAGSIDSPVLQTAELAWSASVTADPAATTARWAPRPIEQSADPVDWRVAEASAPAARAAAAAARRVVAVPQSDAGRRVTVIWSDAPERDTLRQAAEPPSRPWMADVLASLPPMSTWSAGGDEGRLLLFVDEEPGSLASARILAALRGAVGGSGWSEELEPEVIDEAVLRGWQRPVPPARDVPGNDGRWLWLTVLGLLVVEQVARRGGTRSGVLVPPGAPHSAGDGNVV